MTQVIALGDIHGQMAVFDRLHHIQRRYPNAITVFIGDYIDGHVQGFDVLQAVRAESLARPDQTVVLRGNHEQIMLDYLADPEDETWLFNGGSDTMAYAIRQQFGRAQDPAANRQRLLASYAGLLTWVDTLPIEYAIGKLRFVHAGYDLSVANPISLTSEDMKLWAREDYWYGAVDGVFAHNPLPATIVSGHTPTGYIEGRYDGDAAPAKVMDFSHHPVYKMQYPGEFPRVFIDGGNHGGATGVVGNIVVLDSDSGQLLETFEDPQT
ncbi:metallophosphoesterase [Lacticaseibacillus sp. N501-2]|uniref:metallophosphoesterase n=1 Tax=Lacticaseibacillus salsurae TaxID=3367729 RepID=UPI0038B2E12D